MGRWYLYAALAGTLAFGVYLFFEGGWTTHLPDGTVEECQDGARSRGIDPGSTEGFTEGGFSPGLRCEVNGTSFFMPATGGDYVSLLVWAVLIGAPLGLLVMAALHPVIYLRRRRREPETV